MLNQAQKVRNAVLTAPYLIPKLMKPPYNPMITKHILKTMVGRSTGIEIECFGSLGYQFVETKDMRYPHTSINHKIDVLVENYYSITDYAEDQPSSYNNYCKYSKQNNDDNGFNEHKIRISDYKQLPGLFEILGDMKKYCRLNMQSGIHLHIDISAEYNRINITKLAETITTRMDDIENIFYPNSKYDFDFNTDRRCGTSKGHNWIAIRNYKTVEFRIAPMTFEYSEIVRWIVECQKIVRWAIKKQGIKRIGEKLSHRQIMIERITEFLQSNPAEGGPYHPLKRNDIKQILYEYKANYSDDILSRNIQWGNGSSTNQIETLLNHIGINTK